MTQVVIGGHAYSDDGSAARDMRGGGHRAWLLPMIADTAAVAAALSGAAADAAADAAAAGASASAAAGSAAGAATSAALAAAAAAGARPLPRVARSSNTALAADDGSKWIALSGTWTQTFAACATLTAGWWVYLVNEGSGGVTLDPNGAETIDGLTSFIMYPGEARLVQCDGATLRSIVISPFSATFTSSGTFIRPPGYAAFAGLLWGGASSGARRVDAVNNRSAAGGGGGGCMPFMLPASAISAAAAVVIGAGGAPVDGVGAAYKDGLPGGDSSFDGGLVIANGAPAATAGNASSSGTATSGGLGAVTSSDAGAIYSGLYYNGSASTQTGRATQYGGAVSTVVGDSSVLTTIFGGGAGSWAQGGTSPSARSPSASTTRIGGPGGAASVTGDGADGTAPAGGGGACCSTNTAHKSGAGARGELRIWGVT